MTFPLVFCLPYRDLLLSDRRLGPNWEPVLEGGIRVVTITIHMATGLNIYCPVE